MWISFVFYFGWCRNLTKPKKNIKFKGGKLFLTFRSARSLTFNRFVSFFAFSWVDMCCCPSLHVTLGFEFFFLSFKPFLLCAHESGKIYIFFILLYKQEARNTKQDVDMSFVIQYEIEIWQRENLFPFCLLQQSTNFLLELFVQVLFPRFFYERSSQEHMFETFR